MKVTLSFSTKYSKLSKARKETSSMSSLFRIAFYFFMAVLLKLFLKIIFKKLFKIKIILIFHEFLNKVKYYIPRVLFNQRLKSFFLVFKELLM